MSENESGMHKPHAGILPQKFPDLHKSAEVKWAIDRAKGQGEKVPNDPKKTTSRYLGSSQKPSSSTKQKALRTGLTMSIIPMPIAPHGFATTRSEAFSLLGNIIRRNISLEKEVQGQLLPMRISIAKHWSIPLIHKFATIKFDIGHENMVS